MHYDQHGPRYDGRFSDGKTAAAENVRVSLHERGIVVSRVGQEDLIWPYGALSTAEPLSPHAVDALVSYKYQPGASLFVPSGAFARKLAEAAPHLTTRAARRRAAAPWLWAAASVMAISLVVAALQLSPARTIAGLMPDSVRDGLGERSIQAMTDGKKVCATPAGTAAVEALSRRLGAAAPEGTSFKIVVVDWSLVNAFATPGNRIVLTRGLITKAGGPDEVAGVLAHEMGHGIELHPEAGIVRAIGLTAAVDLMLGGGGGTLGNIGAMLVQLNYSRQAEREADDWSLKLLREARISPRGIADFFRRMEETTPERASGAAPGGLAGMLSTHPATAERLKRIAAEPKYPATPALGPAEWQAMRTMCGSAQPE